jgi:hypothetical protein
MENLLIPEVEPVSDLDLSGYRMGCGEFGVCPLCGDEREAGFESFHFCG